MSLLERFVQKTCDVEASWPKNARLLNYTGADVMASSSDFASTSGQRDVICDSEILKC